MNWHAALVHFPIALAFVWPVVDLVGLWTGIRAVGHTAVGLLVAACLSSVAATATGQLEHDAAYAAGVPVELLASHADRASLVPWVLLAVAGERIWGAVRFGRAGHGAGLVLGFLAMVLVAVVAHSGGELVYRHGVGVAPGLGAVP